MFLHIFAPQNRAPQRYVSAIPALNLRRYGPLNDFPRDTGAFVYSREVISDCIIYEKNAAGFWLKKVIGSVLWDCEIILNLPIVLHRGDVYEWEMIGC